MTDCLTRRRLLAAAGAGAAPALLLAGCDRLGASPSFRDIVLGAGEWLDLPRPPPDRRAGAGAANSTPSDMSPMFRTNGNTAARDRRLPARTPQTGFADWRLVVDGLVETPAACSLAELRALPARTQITRHDCVEGWSAIGKWTGVPLGRRCSSTAQLQPRRATSSSTAPTTFDGTAYYESIDLIDAFHPQTILAYGMNDATARRRPRRAAAAAGRAPARLQARQIRHAHRGGRSRLRRSAGARAASGRIRSATNGTPASKPPVRRSVAAQLGLRTPRDAPRSLGRVAAIRTEGYHGDSVP